MRIIYIYIIDYNSGLAKGLSSWNPRHQQKPIEPVPCITIASFLHLFVANILRTHKTNSTCDEYSNMFTNSSVKTNSGNIQATHVHFTVTNIMLVQYVMRHDYDYIMQLTQYSRNNRILIWISSNLILLISMPIQDRAAFKGLLSFAPSIIHRTLHGGSTLSQDVTGGSGRGMFAVKLLLFLSDPFAMETRTHRFLNLGKFTSTKRL